MLQFHPSVFLLNMDPAIQSVLSNHGGCHQRLALPALPTAPSHLGDRLLQLWAWGVLSATNVQWLAEGSILDGADHEQLKQLANIGSHGSYPGNCRRDLLVMVHCTHAGVQPLPLDLPVIEGDRLVLRKYAMISPVRLCDYIFKRFPAVFRQLFGVDDLDTFLGASAAG